MRFPGKKSQLLVAVNNCNHFTILRLWLLISIVPYDSIVCWVCLSVWKGLTVCLLITFKRLRFSFNKSNKSNTCSKIFLQIRRMNIPEKNFETSIRSSEKVVFESSPLENNTEFVVNKWKALAYKELSLFSCGISLLTFIHKLCFRGVVLLPSCGFACNNIRLHFESFLIKTNEAKQNKPMVSETICHF